MVLYFTTEINSGTSANIGYISPQKKVMSNTQYTYLISDLKNEHRRKQDNPQYMQV